MKLSRSRAPPRLAPAMELFYDEFPPSVPVGFIVMRFGSTDEHTAIFSTLKEVSAELNIPIVRADHRQYDEDLFDNVRAYMHGCAFAISIFEDAEKIGFNPNVALEVGYLHALGKPTLHLRSKSLARMPSDLLNKLYLEYDAANITVELKLFISDWISRRVAITPISDQLKTSVETVSKLLRELYPSLPIQDHDQHLPRHVEGLLNYHYLNIGMVRRLLERTENARAWVSSNSLPEFGTCAVSHALGIVHTDYASEPFWKGTTASRLREAHRLFPPDDSIPS